MTTQAVKNPYAYKSKFGLFDSVLSEGFTIHDATPPNMPSHVAKFRKIGIYNLAEQNQKEERLERLKKLHAQY